MEKSNKFPVLDYELVFLSEKVKKRVEKLQTTIIL